MERHVQQADDPLLIRRRLQMAEPRRQRAHVRLLHGRDVHADVQRVALEGLHVARNDAAKAADDLRELV